MVNTTINKFGKKLPPVKTGQRFGEEIKKDKKVGLFSERRFLIFTKRGPIEIAFKPIHYASVIMTTVIGLTSIVYWSAKGIYSAIDVAKIAPPAGPDSTNLTGLLHALITLVKVPPEVINKSGQLNPFFLNSVSNFFKYVEIKGFM